MLRPLALARALSALALVAAGCGGERVNPVPALPEACRDHAFTDAGGVRLFVVQPRVAPEHWVSRDAFRAHLVGLVDAYVRPCLAPDRPNLITFPENVGLPAAFIGSRAAAAREKPNATAAFLALSEPYAPAIAHYEAQWPGLGIAQGIVLGLTDTLWRAFFETARDIARSTGAHVVASTNVSGAVEESSDPADLAALRDPDLPDAASVYVARDRAVYNAAYVFSPEGEIVAVARKPYLVEAEEGQLQLAYGALRDVAPIDLGFARLGVVTSKDAWMPDVLDRLDALGADLLVQPEAFSGWGIEEHPGDWLPDVVQQSGWAATQKYGGIRHSAIPCLTGNLFDLVFDGQSAMFADAPPGERRLGYVGQDPSPGFLAVAPWIMDDPVAGDPSLSLEERRAALRAAAEAALPGGENENGYVEAVVAADVDPRAPFPEAPDGAPGAFGPSAALAPSAAGEQVAPAAAASASGAFVVWQDDRDGRPQIWMARSIDGGHEFEPARAVAPSQGEQRAPAVVAAGDEVWIAWQERAAGESRVVVAVSSDAGQRFAPAEAPNASAGPGADEWGPALAAADGAVYLAFAALVGGNERVLVARSGGGAEAWLIAPADPDPPAKPAGNTRNNQWAPAIAAQGAQVAVAWVDFRNYNWDVFLGRSLDGGATFLPPLRVDDGTDAPERIHDDPSLIFRPDGSLTCAWTDVRLRQPAARARVVDVSPDGTIAAASRALGGAPAWRPRLAARADAASDVAVAVWQDFRSGGNDVYLASSPGGSGFGEELRVDDGGDGPSQQLAPAAALTAAGLLAVWEDTRSGRRQLRSILAPTPR